MSCDQEGEIGKVVVVVGAAGGKLRNFTNIDVIPQLFPSAAFITNCLFLHNGVSGVAIVTFVINNQSFESIVRMDPDSFYFLKKNPVRL